jgi:hypothetical protein
VKDIVSGKGSWQIEDWCRAVECFIPMLFRPVLVRGRQVLEVLKPAHVKTAYGHLRRFAVFHMTMGRFQTWEELGTAADKAAEELLAYGKLAETVRGTAWGRGGTKRTGRGGAARERMHGGAWKVNERE